MLCVSLARYCVSSVVSECMFYLLSLFDIRCSCFVFLCEFSLFLYELSLLREQYCFVWIYYRLDEDEEADNLKICL